MEHSHFISRKVRLTHCMRCGVSQWEGIAEGLPFRVDPIPLTIQGELQAVLQHRDTFALIYGLRQLYFRSISRMKDKPRPAVFAWHACDKPLWRYIDTSRSDMVMRIMSDLKRAIELKQYDPQSRPMVEENAIMSICQALGGRIISEDVPF